MSNKYQVNDKPVDLFVSDKSMESQPYNSEDDDDGPDVLDSEEIAAELGLPMSVVQPILVGYRSVGIGLFGAGMRFAGMPLEKIALYMNSSQVSGKNQLSQAIRLTFQDGSLAPYRVVGPASLTAWFLQYSVMGIAFQFCDQLLSQLLNVRPMYYGKELMEPPEPVQHHDVMYQVKASAKTFLSPFLAATMESFVSNRAEVQRYFGPPNFASLQQSLPLKSWYRNPIVAMAGPAFMANTMRNVIMCQTSFVVTPLAYKYYFPTEHKNKSTLFWFGLGINICCGNVVAITQQALWGRSLDYWARNVTEQGTISYRQVIQEGFAKEGMSSFFTGPKWFSRVLMNAPAQGTLPWFYNEVLPLGERTILTATKSFLYEPYLAEKIPPFVETPETVYIKDPLTRVSLQRHRTRMATFPTAHPEFGLHPPHHHHHHHNRHGHHPHHQNHHHHTGSASVADPSSSSSIDIRAHSPRES